MSTDVEQNEKKKQVVDSDEKHKGSSSESVPGGDLRHPAQTENLTENEKAAPHHDSYQDHLSKFGDFSAWIEAAKEASREDIQYESLKTAKSNIERFDQNLINNSIESNCTPALKSCIKSVKTNIKMSDKSDKKESQSQFNGKLLNFNETERQEKIKEDQSTAGNQISGNQYSN